ncbi:helix-turn-helix domain-containing protein [Micromonospora aurantiaca]|uniref:ArsR/SmtB family transcription factor n=1 Tax=Micromonospora aurantiaca (nom. illeg.) TaxID=47850 RepID=UPI003456AF1A
MISVDVASNALGQVRVAISPLWESVASMQLLSHDRPVPWPYSAWAMSARRALAGRPGADLVWWIRNLSGPVPPFLTPLPAAPTRTFEEELADLRHTPTDLVGEQLARAGSTGGPGGSRDPGAWLRWYADALEDYWQVALRPYWPMIGAALREDVLLRGHTLATRGAAALLDQLEGRVRWEAPRLVLAGPTPSAAIRCDRSLVIVPLLFGRRTIRCVSDDDGIVAVSFQARGAAVLGSSKPGAGLRLGGPERGDRLRILVGRARAAVLRGLTAPTTTSTLANSLGLSASTVSEHLSALVAANVVQRRRVGGRVLYELDHTGSALLEYLDNDA